MDVSEFIKINMDLVSISVFFTMILAELIAIKLFKAKGEMPAKDSLSSIFLGLMSGPMNGLTAFITLGILSAIEPLAPFHLPLTWPIFIVCFIIDDLRFYVHHRIAHRCRWVWAMHYVHHSSENYNMAVALRQAWTKHFTGTMLLKIPLVFMGFDPLMVTFCGILNATYQFFLHTETINKMPKWFEAVFNTPSHHRVHHANNPKYLDANYAGTLIIWDKMFGSFVAEDAADKPIYGLVTNLNTFNPFKILAHEYIGIAKDIIKPKLSLWQRLCYVFAPPGWSHDKSRLTSGDIKRAAGIEVKGK